MGWDTALVLGIALAVSSCFIASADYSGETARRMAYSECTGLWSGETRKLQCAALIYGERE